MYREDVNSHSRADFRHSSDTYFASDRKTVPVGSQNSSVFIFQIIFKKYLTKRQWISLIILTIGCMLKQINFGDESAPSTTENAVEMHKNTIGLNLSTSAVFILIQAICSCLAGVYNEYLLKDKGSDVNIYVQNVFMYIDSIVCNIAVLLVQGNLFGAFRIESLQSIFRVQVILIMFNNAAIGIITSKLPHKLLV